MTVNSQRVTRWGAGVATTVAAILLSACGSMQSTPKQVQATNPTVTYKYRNDDELVKTNELASTFCQRYQAIPRAVRFTTDSDQQNVVVYECAASSGSPLSDVNPGVTYTYRTDQELLQGSLNAQNYCARNGSTMVDSKIVRNGDGTRTATFRCKAS